MINNETIKAAMAEAEMGAEMVVQESNDYISAIGIAALKACGKADASGNAVDAHRATAACEKWIDANETAAMGIINRRIEIRAKRAAEMTKPITADEADRILGM